MLAVLGVIARAKNGTIGHLQTGGQRRLAQHRGDG